MLGHASTATGLSNNEWPTCWESGGFQMAGCLALSVKFVKPRRVPSRGLLARGFREFSLPESQTMGPALPYRKSGCEPFPGTTVLYRVQLGLYLKTLGSHHLKNLHDPMP
jgi:hypothetical protein